MEWQKTTFGELKEWEQYLIFDPSGYWESDASWAKKIEMCGPIFVKGVVDHTALTSSSTVYRLVSPEQEALEIMSRAIKAIPTDANGSLDYLDDDEKSGARPISIRLTIEQARKVLAIATAALGAK